MKQNKQAFSLVIAMGIVLVSSLLAYTILEYMIPFSRNVKGIENATKAYYNSNQGIEKGLYFFNTRENKNIIKDTIGASLNYTQSYSGYIYTTSSSGSSLPKNGDGNSEYDSDWNTISIGNPIQLSVGYNFITDINNFNIKFRVPDTAGNGSRGSLKNGIGYISWQLAGGNGVLYSSSGSLIKGDNMNANLGKMELIKNLEGISYTAQGDERQNINFNNFFEGNSEIGSTGIRSINCNNSNTKCILKFSVVRELETNIGLKIPYLEWKIDFGGTHASNIPLRYSVIESTGKSGGFARKLKLRYPQDTVNQALDFAVFQ